MRYTRTITNTTTETVTEELEVPTDWSMFTSAGNKRITTLATKFVQDMEKEDSYIKLCSIACKFLAKYRDMDRFESYEEAGDTAVRECVGYFFDKVCGIKEIEPDALWDIKESYPKRKQW